MRRRGDEVLDIEASFIRAPIVTRVGEGVEVIATVPFLAPVGEGTDRDVDGQKSSLDAGGDAIVGVRQGNVTALSFHPEENEDSRLHAAWLASL